MAMKEGDVKELKTLAADPEKRPAVVRDCGELIDQEVRSKKGLSGAAVKAAYSLVKAVKPNIIQSSVESLLDEFTDALDAYYARYQEEGESGTLEDYMAGRRSDVAESMLSVTDKRAQRSTHKTLVKAYQKLRPKGKVHVELAVPAVGRMLDKHVATL